MFGLWFKSHRIFKRAAAKALIRLHVCAGLFEPLLVAHTTFLEISCLAQMYLFKTNLDLFIAYAQAGLSLCWSHVPHCWKSHVAAQMNLFKTSLDLL